MIKVYPEARAALDGLLFDGMTVMSMGFMIPPGEAIVWRGPMLHGAITQMLTETSRTFALAIPLLPEPTRGDVTIAYLLFRIADTFEDAAHMADFTHIAGGHSANDRATVRKEIDDADARQFDEGFADRRMADAEARRQFLRAQVLPGAKPALHDIGQ